MRARLSAGTVKLIPLIQTLHDRQQGKGIVFLWNSFTNPPFQTRPLSFNTQQRLLAYLIFQDT
jgi:hypothetical protein